MSDSGIIKIIKRVDNFFNYVSKFCFVVATVLILGVTLMIFASVINRSFIGNVWLFVEEYATLALIPISYSVYGYVLRQDRHLNLDILFNKCPYKVKIGLSIFAAVFTLFVCYYMITESYGYMTYQLDSNVVSSGSMKTPLWGFSLAIFVSIVLFAIDLIFFILNRIIQLATDEQPLKFEGKIYRDKVQENKELEMANMMIDGIDEENDGTETEEGGVR